MSRRYYLDRYTDEIVPCDCTLEGWAAWLAKGGENDGSDWSFEPPAHGTEYKASVIRFGADITAERLLDGTVTFTPPLPSGVGFAALRYGAGAGWSADDILDAGSGAECLIEQLADETCPMLERGETGLLAIGFNEPDVLLRFELGEGGTPRLVFAGLVQ